MPAAPLTVRQVLETHVAPRFPAPDQNRPLDPRRAAHDAYQLVVSTLGDALLDTQIALPPEPGGPVPPEAQPPAGATVPIDPSSVLTEIAKAVCDAESVLNKQGNLALAHGNLNVQLIVKIGDVAGAQATLDLAIGPTPQG